MNLGLATDEAQDLAPSCPDSARGRLVAKHVGCVTSMKGTLEWNPV